MGYMTNDYKIFVGQLKEKEHLGDIGVDGMIMLK
jgi:hypothetical protein